MSEPQLDIWEEGNADVLPEYRLTYRHALFRGSKFSDLAPHLFSRLDLGRQKYCGPVRFSSIPRFGQKKCLVFGSEYEIHLLVAWLNDVCGVFGPHDLIFSDASWESFNKKAGGLMACVSQMDREGSTGYRIFKDGRNCISAFSDKREISIVPDAPIAAYIGGKKAYQSESACSMSDGEIRDFVEHDLALQTLEDDLLVVPRFRSAERPEGVTHFVFDVPRKKWGPFRF